MPSSSPYAGILHHAVKLSQLDPPRDARPTVRLQDHVLEHLLVHVLLEHGGDAAEVGQRYGPALAVGEEPEGLLELVAVRLVRAVLARVEFEGADGEERLVRREAVGLGV